MKFRIEDVRIDIFRTGGHLTGGESYRFVHIPTGFVETIDSGDKPMVKHSEKEPVLKKLEARVEAYNETQDRG